MATEPDRKIFATVLAAALAFGGAGCAKQPSEKTVAKPRMGFAVSATGAHFTQELARGFTAGAQAAGATATVEGPPSPDPPKQVQTFQELAQSHKDGVALAANAPGGPERFARPLADAVQSQVPVVTVDGAPPAGSNVTLCVTNDSYELGQQMGRTLLEQLPATTTTGKVIIGTPAPGAPVLDLRAKGIHDVFAKERPNIQVSGPFYTEQDEAATRKAWTKLVEANPTIVAAVAVGDEGGAIAAVRKATGGTWLGAAFDLNPEALTAVQAGDLVALVSPEHFVKAAVAAELLARHAESGDPLPQGWIYIPGLTVTATNVAQIAARQASDQSRAAALQPQIDKIVKDPKAYLRPLSDAR